MKILNILIPMLIIGISGCEKSAKNPEQIPDGSYFGTFQRNPASGGGQKANIQITFSKGRWTGQSDIVNYPVIGYGTYKTQGNKLSFDNECAFTANFDWSLILSGEYDYTINGDAIALTKVYSNPATEPFTDSYSLSSPKTGIKKSPLDGTWVESVQKTDTLFFSPEFDGQYPVFNLKREKRLAEGYLLPGYFSGPYHYILGENSISVNWFLSSNSAFNRGYFKMLPGENDFLIGNFFTEPPTAMYTDTLTFTKIK